MIVKRGSRFAVSIYDPKTRGKRWVGTYDTRKEAVRAEAEAKLTEPKQTSETCDSFANRWIDDYPRNRESSNIGYRQQIKRFAQDFKDLPLDDLDRPTARRWAMRHGNWKAARAMYSDAKRDDLVSHNPFVDMRLPASRGRKDTPPLTLDEVFLLAEKARELCGPVFEAFVLTGAFTGMRPGEMYALRWPDIRLGDLEIDVRRSYSSKSGETTAPKNGEHRQVVLPPPARDALNRVKPVSPHPLDPVFTTATGKPLTGRTLHYSWDPVRVAAGFPGMSFYMLRHTAAAYLLNVLRIPAHQVAAQLGHTDGGVLVQRLYGHPSAELARAAIKAAWAEQGNVIPLRRTEEAG